MSKLLKQDYSAWKVWPKSSRKIQRLEEQYDKFARKGKHGKCLIILDKLSQLQDAQYKGRS